MFHRSIKTKKSVLPNTASTDFSLEPYGGMGCLKVVGQNSQTQSLVTAELQSQIVADGYSLAEISDINDEIDYRYTSFLTKITLKRCIFKYIDEIHTTLLSEEEIDGLPVALSAELYDAVAWMSSPIASDYSQNNVSSYPKKKFTVLPTVHMKDVPLEPYGGWGVIRVLGMTFSVQSEITAELQGRVVADGYNLAEIKERQKEIDSKYMSTLITITLKRCTMLFDQNLRPRLLTEDEVLNLPVDLASDLYMVVGELSSPPDLNVPM